MSTILIYDTETSGLPLFDQPSDDPRQPHIVQLAAVLADTETQEVVSSIDLIVRPEGWTIPDETAEIHGITTEYAQRFGLPEALVLHFLWSLWENADLRVAHNESFDARIVRIGLKRFFAGRMFPDAEGDETEAPDLWKAGKAECTQRLATPMVKAAATAKMRASGRHHHKTASLSEAHQHFLGVPLENAHSAMADVAGCMEVYFAIKREEVDAEMPATPIEEAAAEADVPLGPKVPTDAGETDDDVPFLGG